MNPYAVNMMLDTSAAIHISLLYVSMVAHMQTSFDPSDTGIPSLSPDDFGLLGSWGALDAGGDDGGGIKCNEHIYYRMPMLFPLGSNSSLNNSSVIILAQVSRNWDLGLPHPKARVIIKSWYRVLNSTQGPIVDKVHNSLCVWTITLWNSEMGSSCGIPY